MQLLDRYIGRAVGGSVLAVIVVVAALLFLITFAGEFDKIGKANYTFWNAIEFTLLKTPSLMYALFPIATLLGSIMGLGALANSHELIVVRSAGISIGRIVISIMKMALVLMIFAFVLGEVIGPPAQQYAKIKRVKALSTDISFNTEYGLWARDGNTYIHVQRADSSGNLHQIHLYTFNKQQQLESLLKADTAKHNGETWVLQDVTQSSVSNERVTTKNIDTMLWKTLMDPELVQIVSVEPETLAIWKLKSYIDYLEDNGLDTANYKLAFWGKVVMPLTIAAMVLLAVPFVMGSMRKTSIGQQILIGFLAGLSFFIANRLLGQMSLVYNFHPAVGAALPSLGVLGIAVLLMRRSN